VQRGKRRLVSTRAMLRFAVIASAIVATATGQTWPAEPASRPTVRFMHNDADGELWVLIDGRKAICYRYGNDVDLPHFYPVLSPDGQPMTVQRTEPYPHHRSFWFADRVQLANRRPLSTYMAYYSGVKKKDARGTTIYVSPFRDGVRHLAFSNERAGGDEAEIEMKLLWYMDRKTPVLDERRLVRVRSLGSGEYFIDITFIVTAGYGQVRFCSDATHYAWPYIRMGGPFAVPGGAKVTTSHGPPGKPRENNFICDWVDYSNSDKGAGLAMFSHRSNPRPHGWLIRDYGTFGPRRIAERNGKPFVLAERQSLQRRVGILVHRGNAQTGKVAERYRQYISGDL